MGRWGVLVETTYPCSLLLGIFGQKKYKKGCKKSRADGLLKNDLKDIYYFFLARIGQNQLRQKRCARGTKKSKLKLWHLYRKNSLNHTPKKKHYFSIPYFEKCFYMQSLQTANFALIWPNYCTPIWWPVIHGRVLPRKSLSTRCERNTAMFIWFSYAGGLVNVNRLNVQLCTALVTACTFRKCYIKLKVNSSLPAVMLYWIWKSL